MSSGGRALQQLINSSHDPLRSFGGQSWGGMFGPGGGRFVTGGVSGQWASDPYGGPWNPAGGPAEQPEAPKPLTPKQKSDMNTVIAAAADLAVSLGTGDAMAGAAFGLIAHFILTKDFDPYEWVESPAAGSPSGYYLPLAPGPDASRHRKWLPPCVGSMRTGTGVRARRGGTTSGCGAPAPPAPAQPAAAVRQRWPRGFCCRP